MFKSNHSIWVSKNFDPAWLNKESARKTLISFGRDLSWRNLQGWEWTPGIHRLWNLVICLDHKFRGWWGCSQQFIRYKYPQNGQSLHGDDEPVDFRRFPLKYQRQSSIFQMSCNLWRPQVTMLTGWMAGLLAHLPESMRKMGKSGAVSILSPSSSVDFKRSTKGDGGDGWGYTWRLMVFVIKFKDVSGDILPLM